MAIGRGRWGPNRASRKSAVRLLCVAAFAVSLCNMFQSGTNAATRSDYAVQLHQRVRLVHVTP